MIIEPFAGSAGYALHYPERKVKLYDANPVIAGIWKWLIAATPEDVLALPVDFVDLNDVQVDLRGQPLSQAAKWFIGFWICGVNATPSTRWHSWARNAKETKSLYWGPVARQLVANAVPKIKHWEAHHVRDFSDVKDEVATWFVDPPYHIGGESYRARVTSFAALGAWCQSRSGQVIACEQEGAKWLPFVPLGVKPKGAPGIAKARGQFTAEVIWHRRSDVEQS